ncbi:MAG: cytochrome-c oxidase, cbb3-type subunit III [Rhodocyclaceae bacterium]|jgi:cytochrome c oxidase cbb3-type subunit 3|nr:cytochrome-c oxidase, cbb3-type subunit III [Rhodocyclaceae bacterium]MBK6907862.1 cytochrome-c oxidase, cbb3-type subunit III [Rhodocyclaceae bacterium]
MSDFVSGFWNIYVAGIVVLSLLFCLVLLLTQAKGKVNPGETTGHVWDEDLREYNNPLPGWWRWLFYITLIFAIAYLFMYPGFGTAVGSFGWSATGQYDKEMKAADEKFGPIFDKFKAQDVATVAASTEARDMGHRLFVTYCAQCHGADAKGGKGFPNLTDKDWLYGGEPEAIKATLVGGRMGVMPPMGAAVGGGDGVKDVANYVRSLSGLASDSIRAQRGKALFATNCAACHGPDAKGMTAMGAPNLTDEVWLYGSSEATISETITNGRVNQMPAFGEFLGEAKVHLLTAYVYGKSAAAK